MRWGSSHLPNNRDSQAPAKSRLSATVDHSNRVRAGPLGITVRSVQGIVALLQFSRPFDQAAWGAIATAAVPRHVGSRRYSLITAIAYLASRRVGVMVAFEPTFGTAIKGFRMDRDLAHWVHSGLDHGQDLCAGIRMKSHGVIVV